MLDRAKELLEVQVNIIGGHNRNSARLILLKKHGQGAVDNLIRVLV